MSFDVDLLLRSKNYSLTNEFHEANCPSFDNETPLWQDSVGPLRLGRVHTTQSTHYRLHLDDDVAVDVLPDRQLAILASPHVPAATVEHFIADQVLPRVISHDGKFVLHAGAVRLDDDAILILGASGRGKSTLAASFHCHGRPLMGDDAIIITPTEAPTAKSLYASLRLFPDSIAAVLPEDVLGEEIAHYSEKQRLLISIIKDADPASARIEAIFVLDEPSRDAINLTRLSIADACMAIVENSFALDPTDPQRARLRLEAASDLARKVPAFALSYPRDYERLPLVRRAMLSVLQGL